MIDTFSLNDPAIAIDGRDASDSVLDQDPDLVIAVSTTSSESRPRGQPPRPGALFAACLARGMRPALILLFSAASHRFVMARLDSEIERDLRRTYLEHTPGARTRRIGSRAARGRASSQARSHKRGWAFEAVWECPCLGRPEDWRALARCGGFPTPAVHLETTRDRAVWFDGYVRTYLERDLQDLSSISASPDFRR